MIYFTSICSNYLPKAMALAESVKANCADSVFVLCLVERNVPDVAKDFPHFDRIILAKDAGWDDFEPFMFRHSIVEASTAVKPQFMRNLLEIFPESDKFVYLDPDVLVYSDFVELREKLDEHSIVVCPHLLRPGNVDMEISSLAHGTYNLGFLAIRRSANSENFLKWWAERLFLYCYDDKVRGIFTDQKWIDLAPSFYDVHILKHHGYDFATWSLLGSDLRESAECQYVVNGDPLRFIHFSGLDSGMIERAMGWWLTSDNRPVFESLYRSYLGLLEKHGQEKLGKMPWTYANYENGQVISKQARVAYRDPGMWSAIPAPFASSNESILECASSLNPSKASSSNESMDVPVLRMPANPSIIDRFMWSSLNVGIGPTVVKAIRKLTSK